MRRKRKKRTLRIKPILVVLLVMNITVGLIYSPITSTRRLRVEGGVPAESERIEKIASTLVGVPCAQVAAKQFETSVLENPAVRTADLSRSIFGTAVLRVGYRRPVAVLESPVGVGLTIDGVCFPVGNAPEGLPVLRCPEGKPETMLSVAADWPLVDVAAVAAMSKELEPQKPIRIDLERGGSLCLNISEGSVELGSCFELDVKFTALKSFLSRHPDFWTSKQTLVLKDPRFPKTKLKKVENTR